MPTTPPSPTPVDYRTLLHDARLHVESSPLYDRFIDGTPLANDIAVWMADFALKALQNAADCLGVPRWRPISEAPKDGTAVLVWMFDWHPAWPEHGVGVAHWTTHNGGGWVSHRRGIPTHWMPLPPAPPEGE